MSVKTYYYKHQIGKARHCVSFHNGVSTHKDGSPFFDMHICKNKRNLARFIKALEAEGYTERNAYA